MKSIVSPCACASVLHQFQYLRLDSNIQRRNGFIGNDKLRPRRQGATNGYTLALPA